MRLINTMIADRRFRVVLNGKTSKWRTINNGLPQGSVLSPAFFNIYTSDLPKTTSAKLVYADDIALIAQGTSLLSIEQTLSSDLATLERYFQRWMLRPNPAKTMVTAHHLDNKAARATLNVLFCGKKVEHVEHAKYLGVTFDRTLTFRQHLDQSRQKVKTRLNLLRKIAGTTWGAGAKTLRTAALALVYSTAEYCAPVWGSSSHTKKLDTMLNAAMRTVSGALKSTKTEWLPTLANIAPPRIRRDHIASNFFHRLAASPHLPAQRLLENPPPRRLKSRLPPWERAAAFLADPVNVAESWQKVWNEADVPNKCLITNPSAKLPGFDLPRKQ
jgi:hypothetical protein